MNNQCEVCEEKFLPDDLRQYDDFDEKANAIKRKICIFCLKEFEKADIVIDYEPISKS